MGGVLSSLSVPKIISWHKSTVDNAVMCTAFIKIILSQKQCQTEKIPLFAIRPRSFISRPSSNWPHFLPLRNLPPPPPPPPLVEIKQNKAHPTNPWHIHILMKEMASNQPPPPQKIVLTGYQLACMLVTVFIDYGSFSHQNGAVSHVRQGIHKQMSYN